MKYIKTYENLLKGKDIDRILSELEGKSNNEKIKTLIKLNRFDLLPRNEDGVCVYDGYLDLNGCQLNILPDNLTVSHGLYCYNNQLTSLPKNLKVGRNLICMNNNLTSLPDNLIVKSSLFCYDNDLTRLPDNLQVGGDLWCSDQKTGIKLILPKTAKVKGQFIN